MRVTLSIVVSFALSVLTQDQNFDQNNNEHETGNELEIGNELETGNEVKTGNELETGNEVKTGNEIKFGNELETVNEIKIHNEMDDDEDSWIDLDARTTERGGISDPGVTEVFPKLPLENTPDIVAQLHHNLQQQGPGAMGAPYKIENPSPEQKKLIEEGYQRHAFNEYISDLIPLRRSLPDFRNHWCKKPGIYTEDMLPASVVMCFHNEAYSVLLRSVHSILDRTPDHLLTEIILADDNSDLENLKGQLDEYVSNLPKVKIVRSDKRLGLIKARMFGAKYADGPILVFLDSHVEVTDGWLEPMSNRITQDPKNVVCPIIDVIDDDTMEFRMSERSVTAVGGFSWNMVFTWKTATDEVLRSLKTPADPVPSPTMAGGLFAIHKEFFNHLGQYDDEYEIWGAENLEISFKAWMCGGRLEIIPCSHIGHLYRKRAPYTRNGADKRPHRNYIRLAAVWLDDYAKYYYQKIGNNLGDFGDITQRLLLKKHLQCKSFEWFIQNVYPDVFNPKYVAAEGEIRNEAFGGDICLDAYSTSEIDTYTKKPKIQALLYNCHGMGGNQHWYVSKDGELRRDESCLDYAGDVDLVMYPCHGLKGNQLWNFDHETGYIIHVLTQKCLTLHSRDKVLMAPCEERITQRWKIRRINPKRLAKLKNLTLEWTENVSKKP